MNDAGRIGFVLKGEYEDTATYDFLDVVYYNSASYVAKKLTVGNVPQENNEFWQVLTKCTGSEVTGVKGKNETEYRTGNVEITPDNIGALSLTGGTVNGETTFNADVTVDNLNISRDRITSLGERNLFELKGCVEADNGDYLNILNYLYEYEEAYNIRINGIGIKFIDYDGVNTLYAYSGMIITESVDFVFVVDNTDKRTNYVLSGDSLYVIESGAIDLGRAARKWKNIYATNGTIQTSDRNEKNTIEELSSEKAQQLIYGLKPSTYKMNAGTSGRTHWGIISQDIEALFEEIGMTSLDFAGFIKSPKMHIEEEECDENGKITKERVEEVIEGEYDYSLRYDEFIAPIIKVIQSQREEIEVLKQQVQNLINTAGGV